VNRTTRKILPLGASLLVALLMVGLIPYSTGGVGAVFVLAMLVYAISARALRQRQEGSCSTCPHLT
jgi:hypothetical protein